MADEKWIAELRGDMPVSLAARRVLAMRLAVVRDRLPAAVFQADVDVENVHQLRVGTRRAAAALRIFARTLSAKLYEKTRKTLKALRRSAGAARDWDVFREMVEPRLVKASPKTRTGLAYLLGYARAHRDLAQEHLRTAHEAKADAFNACIESIDADLLASRTDTQTFRELAGTVLPELLRELETAARADLQSYEALHQVRILGKQLRYAMEIFASCFQEDFRQKYYPAVVEMQDILGLANDSHTACERLGALRTRLMSVEPTQWPRLQGGIELLIHFHEQQLPQQRRKFEKWWRAWLKSGAEQAFAELIRGN